MATNPDIKRLLGRLTRLRTDDHRVVTCYLKVEPRDRARGKYLIKLKNRVKEVGQALDGLEHREPFIEGGGCGAGLSS